jgi:hypothetical protein
MSTRFDLVTIDGDTSLLQAFWSSALALHEVEREDGDRWVVLACNEVTLVPAGSTSTSLVRPPTSSGNVSACSVLGP